MKATIYLIIIFVSNTVFSQKNLFSGDIYFSRITNENCKSSNDFEMINDIPDRIIIENNEVIYTNKKVGAGIIHSFFLSNNEFVALIESPIDSVYFIGPADRNETLFQASQKKEFVCDKKIKYFGYELCEQKSIVNKSELLIQILNNREIKDNITGAYIFKRVGGFGFKFEVRDSKCSATVKVSKIVPIMGIPKLDLSKYKQVDYFYFMSVLLKLEKKVVPISEEVSEEK